MRRAVITGIGIVSSIGDNKEEVLDSLKEGHSGITFAEEYAEMGFRSHVYGIPKINLDEALDRKIRRFMGDGAGYNYIAMLEAIEDSKLKEEDISDERTGLIMGSGGPSTRNLIQAADSARTRGPRKVGPFMVPRCMSSTVSACLSTMFKIKESNMNKEVHFRKAET